MHSLRIKVTLRAEGSVPPPRGESVNMTVKSLSRVSAAPWPVALQAPVHGILRARVLEWVAFPFSRGSSRPRDRTQVSCIAGRFFTL